MFRFVFEVRSLSERLLGKISFVTGGGRGIGRGICLALAKAGSDVVVSDIILENAESVRDEVKDLGRDALSIKVDVADRDSIERGIKHALDEFNRIDILVNNAGVIKQAPVHELTEEDWDLVVGVNAKGIFLCSKAVIPHRMGKKSGRIVNISSISGKNGYPGQGVYGTSKFAAIGLTQVLARELAKYNITVNAICPGIIYTYMWEYLSSLRAEETGLTPDEVFKKITTERIPLGRPQSPEDIGNLVVFLASDEAKNITGQSINVDGGLVTH
jgi:meso-butanediol dehydrogenase/(S,S)-butanediol dehydrogenase/diacetyl reductase